MNRINIYIIGILVTMSALFWTSCGDDELRRSNTSGSRLEEVNNFKLSIFNLDKGIWEIPDTTTDVRISLRSLTDNSLREYDAKVRQEASTHEYSIYIPKTENIPDSDYELTAALQDGKSLGMKLKVTFRDEMLHTIIESTIVYSGLKGEGTAENPYLIGSQDDFDTFEYNLYRDSLAHGAGLYFRQTASFDAPPRSDVYVGRYYKGYPFAGIYDGSGYAITIAYIGSQQSDDDNIGLFQSLLDGSLIQNLTLKPRMQGIRTNGGALAGSANGTVILQNVSVDGSITGCGTNIGGFIGYATGNLSAYNCRLYCSIEATSYAGGLVGYMKDGILTVDDFSNLQSDYSPSLFTIHANNRGAGGIAGALANIGCTIKNITLQHSISEQDALLKVIYAGTDRAGGLVGEMQISQNSSIKSVSILAPVRSDSKDTGGMVGTATLRADLTLQGCSFASFAKGQTHVGGFFGYLKSDKHLFLSGINHGNRIAQVDNGYIAIEGSENVGGMFGYLEGDINADAVSLINTNVTTSATSAGGVAGQVYNNTLQAEMFSLDKDMHVRGMEKVGGLVGYARHSSIKGDTEVKNLTQAIPDPDSFTSHFAGTITDANDGDTGTAMGGIVGYVEVGYVGNLCMSGSVFGQSQIGGIVGYISRGLLTNCVNKAEIVQNNKGNYTGGICGKSQFDVYKGIYNENLLNYGKVNGKESTGGICGNIEQNNICEVYFQNCVNTAAIDGSSHTGGLFGQLYNPFQGPGISCYFKMCANYGDVEGSGGTVGGIIGKGQTSQVYVLNSANHGNVKGGKQAERVGGIAGSLGWDPSGVSISSNLELAYCCNKGTIQCDNSKAFVGGLLGYQEEGSPSDDQYYMTHDCYNMGEVTSSQDHDNGGIIGCVDHYAEVQRCYNTGKVKKGNGVVGTHKSSCIWYHHDLYYLSGSGDGWCADSFNDSEKQSESTFKNFDFKSVWKIDNSGSVNNGFPYLQKCPFQSINYTTK